jgi:hypothetical protein
MTDPFARTDDYPALFGEWRQYWWKTLSEGRWLNHLWMARPAFFDRHALFWLFAGLWCAAWALTAVAAFRGDRGPWRALPAAAALALMPQGALFAAWPYTTIPAAALLAGYAAVVALAPRGAAVGALLVFVPLGWLAYTTLPLLMLGVLALGADWRDARPRAVLRAMALFCAAFAAGYVIVQALNWAIHGHFGIVIPRWREAGPADSLPALLANLADFAAWLADTLHAMAGESALLALVLAWLVASGAWRAAAGGSTALLALAGTAVVALAVFAAQQARTGMELPVRAVGVLWLAGAGAAILGLRHAAPGSARAAAAAGVAFAALWGGVLWHESQSGAKPAYQALTRAMAARIEAAAAGAPIRRIVIGGTPFGLAEGGVLQHGIAIQFRIRALTGVRAAFCGTEPAARWREGRGPQPDPAIARVLSPDFTDWDALTGRREPCAAHGAGLAALPAWPAAGSAAWVAPGVMGLALPREALTAPEDGGGGGAARPGAQKS